MKKLNFCIVVAYLIGVVFCVAYVCNADIIEPESQVAESVHSETTEIVETTKPKKVEETTTETKQTAYYYDVPLNRSLQNHIFELCANYEIDPALVISIIKRESIFRSYIIGDNGDSYGLMQVQKKYHYERMDELSCYNLIDPYENVTVGVDYLAELFGRGKSVEWVLMAYNSGPSKASEHIRNGVVTNYAKDVLNFMKGLEIKEVEV